jgi:hypothetical protein
MMDDLAVVVNEIKQKVLIVAELFFMRGNHGSFLGMLEACAAK